MRHALRLAVRQFTRHPAFALVTVLVLGLATGASVAVYTVVDAVLLRPLPYTSPQQLLTIWDTNQAPRADARADVARDVDGLPPARRVCRRRRLVAARCQPDGSGHGSHTRQRDPDEREPLFVARRFGAGRARISGGRTVLRSDADRRDQRSAVAGALSGGSRAHRQAALAERCDAHHRRHHAAALPLSGRRGRVAAAELGLSSAQPPGAFRRVGRAAEARRGRRTGAHAGGDGRRTAGQGVRREQRRMAGPARAARRRTARVLPSGADRALRRGRLADGHRLPERGVAPAHACAVARARGRRPDGARRIAASSHRATAGRGDRALDRRGHRRRDRDRYRDPGHRRRVAGGHPAARGSRGQRAGPRIRRRDRNRYHAPLRPRPGPRPDSAGTHERPQGVRARLVAGEPHALSGAGGGRGRARLRAPDQLRTSGANGRPDDERAHGRAHAAGRDLPNPALRQRLHRLGHGRERTRRAARRRAPAAGRARRGRVELHAVRGLLANAVFDRRRRAGDRRRADPGAGADRERRILRGPRRDSGSRAGSSRRRTASDPRRSSSSTKRSRAGTRDPSSDGTWSRPRGRSARSAGTS